MRLDDRSVLRMVAADLKRLAKETAAAISAPSRYERESHLIVAGALAESGRRLTEEYMPADRPGDDDGGMPREAM